MMSLLNICFRQHVPAVKRPSSGIYRASHLKYNGLGTTGVHRQHTCHWLNTHADPHNNRRTSRNCIHLIINENNPKDGIHQFTPELKTVSEKYQRHTYGLRPTIHSTNRKDKFSSSRPFIVQLMHT